MPSNGNIKLKILVGFQSGKVILRYTCHRIGITNVERITVDFFQFLSFNSISPNGKYRKNAGSLVRIDNEANKKNGK